MNSQPADPSQQSQPPLFPPCPNCEIDGSQRVWKPLKGYNGSAVQVEGREASLSQSIQFHMNVDVYALTCLYCGHLQLFSDPSNLQ